MFKNEDQSLFHLVLSHSENSHRVSYTVDEKAWKIPCLSLPAHFLSPPHFSLFTPHFFISHQVRVSVSTVCCGDLSISLESPAGTVSLLLDTRPNDASDAGL